MQETAAQKEASIEKTSGTNTCTSMTLAKGKGVHIWDADGNHYYDFSSCSLAANQGHCHPLIIETLQEQAEVITLTSNALYNAVLGDYSAHVSALFHYDKVIPATTAEEGLERACMIARKWGHNVKGLPGNCATIIVTNDNRWGNSLGAISSSVCASAAVCSFNCRRADHNVELRSRVKTGRTKNDTTDVEGVSKNAIRIAEMINNMLRNSNKINHDDMVEGSAPCECTTPREWSRIMQFGPFAPGFNSIPFDDIEALEKALMDRKVCAFMVEPIQSRNALIPSPSYFTHVRELCSQYNVLLIADETRVGLGRTGELLCGDHYRVRPDIVCLSHSLSGGTLPISLILTDESVTSCLSADEHESIYEGNPLAVKVSASALKVLVEENLCRNSQLLGEVLLAELSKLRGRQVKEVRGKGLLCALVLDDSCKLSAPEVCRRMQHKGVLTTASGDDVICLSPPLNITMEQLLDSISIITSVIESI